MSVSDRGREESGSTMGVPQPYHIFAATVVTSIATTAFSLVGAPTTVPIVTCRGCTYKAVWVYWAKQGTPKCHRLQKVHPALVRRAILRSRLQVFLLGIICRWVRGARVCDWLAVHTVPSTLVDLLRLVPPSGDGWGGCFCFPISIGRQEELLEGGG